jgi:hypothetical protein
MSVDHAHARIILDAPTPISGDAAEGDLLVVEEEILVHPAELGDHRRVHEHARARDPIDGSRPDSPTGLVFPPGAR